MDIKLFMKISAELPRYERQVFFRLNRIQGSGLWEQAIRKVMENNPTTEKVLELITDLKSQFFDNPNLMTQHILGFNILHPEI